LVKAIDRLAGLGGRLRRRSQGDDAGASSSGSGRSSGPTDGPDGARAVDAAGAGDLADGRSGQQVPELPVDPDEEARLWARLHEDPNDVEAFPQLAEIVRRRAAQGHEDHPGGDPEQAAKDAVWALAEELAHNGRAWYPLIELARLSVHEDRDGALRRLGTAAERDPSGCALAAGLAMLREEGLPNDALGLGVGYWRPREHTLEAGRHLVLAAIEARRVGDARRHLAALSLHPDEGEVAELRAELEGLIAQLAAERVAGGPMTDPAGIAVTGPLIDLRDASKRT
jgi:hypothetical protein